MSSVGLNSQPHQNNLKNTWSIHLEVQVLSRVQIFPVFPKHDWYLQSFYLHEVRKVFDDLLSSYFAMWKVKLQGYLSQQIWNKNDILKLNLYTKKQPIISHGHRDTCDVKIYHMLTRSMNACSQSHCMEHETKTRVKYLTAPFMTKKMCLYQMFMKQVLWFAYVSQR